MDALTRAAVAGTSRETPPQKSLSPPPAVSGRLCCSQAGDGRPCGTDKSRGRGRYGGAGTRRRRHNTT